MRLTDDDIKRIYDDQYKQVINKPNSDWNFIFRLLDAQVIKCLSEIKDGESLSRHRRMAN